jgi:hypothetical protein
MRNAQLALPLLLAAIASTRAAEPMHVMTWDPGCEYMMTTTYFQLPPGQSVDIQLDFSACGAEQLGDFMVYGYRLGNNSATQLGARDNVRFTVIDPAAGTTASSDSGYLVTPLTTAGQCLVRTQNLNSRKSLTLSLRSRSGL